MSQTIEQIAKALEARAEGDLTIEVTGASEPAAAGPDQIALAMSEKYAEGLQAGKARAALVWEGADWRGYGLEAAVFVTRPRLAMAGLSKAFDPGPSIASGVHPSCVIDPTAVIGADAAIGPFTIVGPDVRIGPGARIVGQVTIGEGARIGAEALIHAGVRIGAQVVIGDRFVCQPGAVIGSDGFSFVTPDPSGVEEIRQTLEQREEITEQKWTRIHSLGTVEIGDDVEIGANTCIDRGTVRATAIGSGSKLDNLVHIGHNVQVGEDCLLCGQVGVAGSTRIGHRVVLAGQCGVSDNITVGDDVIAAGGTNIYTNVPKGRTIWGSPAVKMETQLEINKSLRRLPRLFAQMAELRETVTKLTQKGGTE
ncbi:UDP-3-O-(3-hydroxymyristoyl)glucosamine N-acyltransferase [Thioclava sp. F42-5]|uniref:UDP-3-O-(3-hydroxymyristoyl)glucosamine N-acyltransferase n=1 Tax=unclassified Thioclava TaxID=2621713 RepID=UPI000B542291|nr:MULTISPECIES: UDP-3-O-(3-hydroxymyristoyl)glucosamine N-acyltransferase [unclassified Thioclava]OWY05308.1 UDP-3-O-(3-hydroxymyristoyl)glucosamine N-acyltransferase [Thioclava sp. F1Mire-8]OWY10599.1 UDP-3-O-(3-hydroxymyristoyl)glucosamine N-acyltransferase [Thioclava sp. F42-5]PWE49655.1 UDP-3-O-(3-hydroxymyristoyl)glucosamine N-acyltransferase [Thioclava sp. NG1]